MTDDIIKRLREAMAAGPTPGPWEAKRLTDNFGDSYSTLYQAHIDLGACMVWAPPGNSEQEAVAAYIAAASPDNIAALLDRLDAAERERDHHSRWRADLADKLHDAESQIYAAWAALRRAGIQSEKTIAEAVELLRAENERLREDAERYRWLTDDHHKWETRERVRDIAFRISVSGKGHIDAAIDAARAAEQSDAADR